MDQGRSALDLCSRATRAIDEADVQADPVAIYFALFYTYTLEALLDHSVSSAKKKIEVPPWQEDRSGP